MIVNLWSYGIIIFLTNRAKSHTNLLQFGDGNGEGDMTGQQHLKFSEEEI